MTAPPSGAWRTAALLLCAAPVLFAAPVPGAAAPAADWLETAIDAASCSAADAATTADYAGRGLAVQDCPAAAGYRLLFVSSEERSWIDLRDRATGAAWSSEQAVVYDHPIGNFPNVAGQVAWRLDAGRATALIFEVRAQDREDPTRRVAAFYLVTLSKPPIALAGRAATEAAARALATADAPP